MGVMRILGIEVRVQKKRIKNIYLRVLPPEGEVLLTAPHGTPDKELHRFVEAKMPWILAHRERILARSAIPAPQYLTGEVHPIWGKEVPLVAEVGVPGASLRDGVIHLCHTPEQTAEQRGALLQTLYREELSKAIAAMLPACEALVGERANEWRIRRMKTRWGSCNTRERRIWLSLELCKKPPERLHYVIIHELCHLRERGHGPGFWAEVAKACPEYREAQALLKAK